MTKLIIVCGLPGAGKTTLARKLSEKLKVFCLHKDSVKESFYDSMKMSTLEDSKKLGYPSVKVILDLAEENLARGIDVILESPFTFSEDGEIFEKWRKKYDLEIFSIILEISENERKERMTNRERDKSHHDEKRLQNYVATQCDFFHMPEKKIFLETSKNTNTLIEIILKELK
ncbi:MAG: ATP-binding protein [Candidatus Moranbacteria bacterium]|jgi:predicted kinase|nr:ATP-binding protein [Candidatus Moranbacteria bacterium]